jgi:hypothetical protein
VAGLVVTRNICRIVRGGHSKKFGEKIAPS